MNGWGPTAAASCLAAGFAVLAVYCAIRAWYPEW